MLISKIEKRKLEKSLNELKEIKRPEVIARLQHARSLGDLSENAEYDAARQDQASIESSILEIEATLKNAEIMESRSPNKSVIGIGSKVTAKNANGNTVVYSVGNISKGGISVSTTSPIGSAIIGKKKGEIIAIQLPSSTIQLTIVDIQ